VDVQEIGCRIVTYVYLSQDEEKWRAFVNTVMKFDVHGSVLLGNLCVRLRVQLDAHGFICILYSSIFALHVSGAIRTHHQEHKLQITAINMCNGYFDRFQSAVL
jgi:hypothetical protein